MSSPTPTPTPSPSTPTPERADLLEALQKHRDLFRVTARGLTDEQARTASTVSALTVGGLVKHVTAVERQWASFVIEGPAPTPTIDWADVDWSDPPPEVAAHADGFRMGDDDSLADLLADYDTAAAATDALVADVDLDRAQPLPEAPWFTPGASWTARRVFVHLIAETAQHAGHADIIREAIDGQRSMG